MVEANPVIIGHYRVVDPVPSIFYAGDDMACSHRTRYLLLPFTLSTLLLSGLTAEADSLQGGRADPLLRVTVESIRDLGTLAIREVPIESGRLLANFYAARDYRPAWERSEQVAALARVVEESRVDGLVPADYHLPLLHRLSKPNGLAALSPVQRLAADLQLSDALLRYSYHIRFGRLDPVAVDRAWNHRKAIPAENLIQSLERVVSAADTESALRALAPQPFYYTDLKQALREYGGSDATSGLTPIPPGRKLVQGDRDPRVVQLRERLQSLGEDVTVDTTDAEVFDPALRAALVGFQRRQGLTADGGLGAGTVAALNKPNRSDKVDLIKMNLERMRWFYDELPPDYVLVDVGGFMAHVVRDGRIDWSTRVVVGTPKAQTPSFRDEMEHVVFNPTWTVPPSIQKKMRGASSKFKVVDRRTGRALGAANVSDFQRVSLVQGPGPTNALGRVKFIFPNDHAVYLHDTTSKGLFEQPVRAYSHGCIRVQNPLKLAEVILGPSQWDKGQIDRVVATNKTRYVLLKERLPVLIYYLTAKANDSGKVEFRSDVYGRDAAMRTALKGPPSQLRIGFPATVPVVDPAVVEVAKTGTRRSGGGSESVPPTDRSPEPAVETAKAPRPTLTQGTGQKQAPALDLGRVSVTAGDLQNRL
jgi:murein L,D-transpeptidase YcbB/YkuD